MRYLISASILLLILIGCENKEAEVIDSYYKKEMGLKWAEKYNQKLTELENQEIDWNYNIDVDMDNLKKQIARSYAENRERTIEEIKERTYTHELLGNYARDKGLYPPDKDIDDTLKELTARMIEGPDFPYIEGQLEGLNMTLEEYITEFLKPDLEKVMLEQYIQLTKMRESKFNEFDLKEFIKKLKEKNGY
jgi:hypothetical protein